MKKMALQIDAIGQLEVRMSRVFNASLEQVFDAWTDPALLQQWLGIRGGWTMPVCEVDLTVGGRYRYVWRNENGQEMTVTGRFQEIERPTRIVCSEKFLEPWYPGEALITHELIRVEGGTLSRMTLSYESVEARDAVLNSPMESGVAESYTSLDTLLTQMLSPA